MYGKAALALSCTYPQSQFPQFRPKSPPCSKFRLIHPALPRFKSPLTSISPLPPISFPFSRFPAGHVPMEVTGIIRAVCRKAHYHRRTTSPLRDFFPPHHLFSTKDFSTTNFIMSLKRINKELLDLGRYVFSFFWAAKWSLHAETRH